MKKNAISADAFLSDHMQFFSDFRKLDHSTVIKAFTERNPQYVDQTKDLEFQYEQFMYLVTSLGNYVYRAGYIAGLHDRGIQNPYDMDKFRLKTDYSPYDFKSEINSSLSALWRWGYDNGKAKHDEIVSKTGDK